MLQEIRNKIYAIGGLLGLGAVVTGLLSPEQIDAAAAALDRGMIAGGTVLLSLNSLMAFVKTLASKATTLDVPRSQITKVETAAGTLVPAATRRERKAQGGL